MNQALKKSLFEKLGLVSLLECHRQFQCEHEPPYAEPRVQWSERTTGVISSPTRKG